MCCKSGLNSSVLRTLIISNHTESTLFMYTKNKFDHWSKVSIVGGRSLFSNETKFYLEKLKQYVIPYVQSATNKCVEEELATNWLAWSPLYCFAWGHFKNNMYKSTHLCINNTKTRIVQEPQSTFFLFINGYII